MNVCEGRRRKGTENCQSRPFRGASQKCKMGSMKKRYYPAKEKVDISSPWQMVAAERLRRIWKNDKFISGRCKEMQPCLQQNVLKESLTQGDLQEEIAQKKGLKTVKPLTWKGRKIRQWLFSLWQIFGRAHHPTVWRKDKAEKIQMHVQNKVKIL